MINITVVSYNNEAMAHPTSLTFGPEGKTMGRGKDNHLVLEDPKNLVSRVHARVKSDGFRHSIVNMSQHNPILVNNCEIEPDREYDLHAGDEIRIGLYVLRAEAQRHTGPSLAVSNGMPVNEIEEPALAMEASPVIGHEAKAALEAIRNASIAGSVPLNHARSAVPEAPEAPPPVSESNQALLDAFLKGAGIPSVTIAQGLTPELMETLGKLLAISIKGTMDLNAQRAFVKREVNADVTMVVVRNNNPLKFLSDSETVLTQMFRKKMPGFMSPAEALQDIYDDLRAHQAGIMAGMRAAINNALKRYDPEALEQAVANRSVIDALMPTRRKAKLWDTFIKSFRKLHVKTQEDFHAIFGKPFLKAYEEEVERHDNQGKHV